MSLTLKQVLRSLYRFPGGYERIGRVPQVRVTNLKRGALASERALRFLARTKTPESSGGRIVMKPYVSSIDYITPKYVRLSCTCPDFWATWEFSLAQHGAAKIIYGNGDPPDTRNPTQLPGCCKHLVAVANLMVKEGYITPDFEVPRS